MSVLAINADGNIPGADIDGSAFSLLGLLLGLASLDLVGPLADTNGGVVGESRGAAEPVGQPVAAVKETGAIIRVTNYFREERKERKKFKILSLYGAW